MEQVLELATDGQEAEAPHRIIFMMKTALILAALLTRHVLMERVVIVLLGHALDVPIVHVAVAVVLTSGLMSPKMFSMRRLHSQGHISILSMFQLLVDTERLYTTISPTHMVVGLYARVGNSVKIRRIIFYTLVLSVALKE